MTLEAARSSLERAERWTDRLRRLAETDASGEERDKLDDFMAAAIGEIAEVLFKAEEAMIRASGSDDRQAAKDRAEKFLNNWLNQGAPNRILLTGLLRLRHLDVHIEPRKAPKIAHENIGGPNARSWTTWLIEAISPEQNERLCSNLSSQQLREFNKMLEGQHAPDVLADALVLLREYLDDVVQSVVKRPDMEPGATGDTGGLGD